MRLWLPLFVTACAAACTQEDPPYGDPGAIAKWSFPGDPSASSSGASGGDGGAPATSKFPAPYNAAQPAAPAQDLKTLHPTVANGAQVAPALQCLAACHGEKATGSTKKWSFAGWAASGPGATTGLDKGEVLVMDGAKAIGPVKTSPDGYFWIPLESGAVTANGKAYVRKSDNTESAMLQNLGPNAGDCNAGGTCHGGSALSVDFK